MMMITLPNLLARLAWKLLRPTLFDSLNTKALVIGITASKVTVRQQHLDDVPTGVMELFVVAHFEFDNSRKLGLLIGIRGG